MCGIAGIFNNHTGGSSHRIVGKMLSLMSHRGPDESGMYKDARIILGHKRLSIIGLASGTQPMANKSKTIWVAANGEIFNFIELKKDLIKKGHRFSTTCDIEVLPHLYEEYGLDLFSHINGQFAFALWDKGRQRLMLARDRFGICPLFYAWTGSQLIFTSEIKAMLAVFGSLDLDYQGLSQVFTFWNTLAPRTVFKGICQVTPGECLVFEPENTRSIIYWDSSFPVSGEHSIVDENQAIEGIREILEDATSIRLRSDVPVGAYLSGGLDSSILATLVSRHSRRMETFSVSFDDPAYDEAPFQEAMGKKFDTSHHVERVSYPDIGDIFENVIWHTETPVLRSAPAPMFLLSRLTRDHGIKVVLTGEGADEMFGGYDIFKEAKIRRFWSQFPDSHLRPQLLFRLYPYAPVQMKRSGRLLLSFYRLDLMDTSHFGYSHLPTWHNTSLIQKYFSDEVKENLAGYDPFEELESILPKEFFTWHPLNQAQYLEIKLLLAGYLLSSQGERMTMANSVEGRYPYLDHRLAEFSACIDPRLKLKGLNEKYILKKAFHGELPHEIFARTKQPYGAPNKEAFFKDGKPRDAVSRYLDDDALNRAGVFDPLMAQNLLRKCAGSSRLGFRDSSAFMGILSTQILVSKFCDFIS